MHAITLFDEVDVPETYEIIGCSTALQCTQSTEAEM